MIKVRGFFSKNFGNKFLTGFDSFNFLILTSFRVISMDFSYLKLKWTNNYYIVALLSKNIVLIIWPQN